MFLITLAELETDLRTRLADTATNKRFSSAEITQAIQDAIEYYSETMRVTDIYEDLNNVWILRLQGNPTAGDFTISYNGNTSAATAYNANVSTIQTNLRALAGLERVIVFQSEDEGQSNRDIEIVLQSVVDLTIDLTLADSVTSSLSAGALIARRTRTTTLSGKYEYPMPEYVSRVFRVQRKLISKDNVAGASSTVSTPWIDVLFEHERNPDGTRNVVYLPNDHVGTLPLRFHYDRPIPVPPVTGTLGAQMEDEDVVGTLATGGTDAYRWEVPVMVQIEDEIIRVNRTLGTLQLADIDRGLYDTLPVAHTNTTAFSPLITVPSRSDYASIKARAMQNLYHTRTQDGDENKASIYVTLYGQKGEELNTLDKRGRRLQPGSLRTQRRRSSRSTL